MVHTSKSVNANCLYHYLIANCSQSERTAIYREHTEKLLQSGSAYRCFCTPERLRALADYRSKLGLPPDYDRRCAHIPKEESDVRAAKGEAHVVRLLMPDQVPTFKDIVYGVVRQRNPVQSGQVKLGDGSYDDPILLKSDGFPTYHLANVVDDHLMKITHVIRGSVRCYLLRRRISTNSRLGVDVFNPETLSDVQCIWLVSAAIRPCRAPPRYEQAETQQTP